MSADIDYEIDAIAKAYSALALVSPNGRLRALDWLSARFDTDHRRGCEVARAVEHVARSAKRLSGYRARRIKQAA